MLPILKAISGVCMRIGIYVIARLKAKPGTKDLVATLQPAQDGLKAAMTAREVADTHAIESGAEVDGRLEDVRDQILVLGVKAFGHFGSRSHDGFVAMFPKSPSKLAQTPVRDRAAVFAKLRKAALAGPKELLPYAKELDAAIGAWEKAVSADVVVTDAFAAAVKAEKKAANEWQTALRVLKARLSERMPRSADKVRTFFPSSPSRKVAQAQTEATPA